MRQFTRITLLWMFVAFVGDALVAPMIDIAGRAPDFTIIALVMLALSAGAMPATIGGFMLGLVQDVAACPYDQGQIVTATNKKPVGKLYKFADERLSFKLDLGGGNFAETSFLLTEIPPSGLVVLGDFYLQRLETAREPNAAEIARRAVGLAVFSREFGLPDAYFQKYAGKARQAGADIKDLAEKVKLDVPAPQLLK